MDFLVGLPLTRRKHDSVWVMVDWLIKSTHFLPVRTNYALDKLTELYIREIVQLHEIPISIISDRDPRFTSIFYRKFARAFGYSTDFQHIVPPTDGWTIRKSDPSVGRYAKKLCDRL